MSDVAEVELVEVSPRDGLQNDPVAVSTAHKVELIERAVAAGFRRVEVASFVNPKRVPQMADAEAVMAALPRVDGVVWSTLALNTRGVERAIAAGADEINFVVTCSETFNQRNQGCSIAESLSMLTEMAPLVREAGKRLTVVMSTSFGCPFEGEVPVTRVVEVALGALEARPDELSLADTIGVAVPSDVIERVGAVRAVDTQTALRCHFHNTRNTAIANIAAALDVGVRSFDASLAGVGGCPFAPAATGNVATEDVAYLLARMGYDTGLDLSALLETARWLSYDVLGRPPESALANAGPFPRAAQATDAGSS